MSDDLVERVARAIADASNSERLNPYGHMHHTSILAAALARAAIDAIKAAGWRPPPDYQPRGPQWLAEMKPPFVVGSQQQPETD